MPTVPMQNTARAVVGVGVGVGVWGTRKKRQRKEKRGKMRVTAHTQAGRQATTKCERGGGAEKRKMQKRKGGFCGGFFLFVAVLEETSNEQISELARWKLGKKIVQHLFVFCGDRQWKRNRHQQQSTKKERTR